MRHIPIIATMKEKDITASWARLKHEAENLSVKEPLLAPLLQAILKADNISRAMAHMLAKKLDCTDAKTETVLSLLREYPPDEDMIIKDLQAILTHDPAASDLVTPFLFFKGFHGLQAYRLAHALWNAGRTHLAVFIQNRISETCGMDIHPAARIGSGVMMDHATGIVIGATAVVEDDVLFWHGITLGGRGLENIDRHPKIRQGALLGANATILGNIEIGKGARIGAGSIVVKPVAAGETVIADTAKTVSRV